MGADTQTGPAGPAPLHILVVDDHALLRDGLAALLQRLRPGCRVSQAGDAEGAQAVLARHTDITLAVVDVHLPAGEPLALLRRLRRSHPLLPVAMLSGDSEPALAARALAEGACGYLPKTADMGLLAGALEVVLKGGRFVPAFVVQQAARPAPTGLTPRQGEILALLAQGLANKEIARSLGLAEPTVKAHLVTIFRVLRVTNRAQAALAARKLADPPASPER